MPQEQILPKESSTENVHSRPGWERKPTWWRMLVVLPWTIGAIFLLAERQKDLSAAERQQTCQGTITSYEPGNHGQYGFTFAVNGKTYRGWESPKYREFAVGKQVTVYYDAQNPAKNALTPFSDLATEVIGPVPVLLLGIGAVAFFVLRRRDQNRPNPIIPC